MTWRVAASGCGDAVIVGSAGGGWHGGVGVRIGWGGAERGGVAKEGGWGWSTASPKPRWCCPNAGFIKPPSIPKSLGPKASGNKAVNGRSL